MHMRRIHLPRTMPEKLFRAVLSMIARTHLHVHTHKQTYIHAHTQKHTQAPISAQNHAHVHPCATHTALTCRKSSVAPVVTWSFPNISSSATWPPMHTQMRASICWRLMLNSSSRPTWGREGGGKQRMSRVWAS